jgi:hypothetical protein
MKNLLLALLLTISAVEASASMVYANRDAWTAAVSTPTTLTFEGIAPTNYYVYEGTSFTNSGVTFSGPGLFVIDSGFSTDYTTGTGDALFINNYPATTKIVLPGSYSAFAIDLRGYSGITTSYTLKFSDNEIFNVSSGNATSFFGVALNGPVTGLSITSNYYASYDNVAFANTKVPEPTTVALLGLGLLGVAASRRKAAKSKNV